MNNEILAKVISSGLEPDVRHRLIATLSKMLPEWVAQPTADWKRVPRPTGEGSFSTNIEPYQGMQSWISFHQKYLGAGEMGSLEKLLRERQPELLGCVIHDGGIQFIHDCYSLCYCLLREATRRIPETVSTDEAVLSVISDLDKLLTTRSAERQILTLLTGLRLPEGVDKISLDNGLYIRLLTADEIAEHGSHDILSGSRYDLMSSFVTVAVISEAPISIRLSPNPENSVLDLSSREAHQERINNILGALHILKSGRVGVLASFTTIRPTILPNMSGYSSAPFVVNPFSFMELTQEDVDRFVNLYAALAATRRDELNIATARLLDAESRLSPVDALLDAVVGLEVLLNPHAGSELSFRVALNYAFLAPTRERRSRFENVREVQLTRNRVVHGGLNQKSKDAPRLHEHAELAKSCLRDAVERFLTVKELKGTRKLDADFWLDRVLPPDVEE